jgi:hypothetical protein
VGTFTISVRRINLVREYISPQLGTQSFQTNRFGSAQTLPIGLPSLQFSHTHFECSHFGQPGPGTQNSSHLQPQQTTSTLLSSRTSLQTFLHGATAPHRAHFVSGLAAPIKQQTVINTTKLESAIRYLISNPFADRRLSR